MPRFKIYNDPDRLALLMKDENGGYELIAVLLNGGLSSFLHAAPSYDAKNNTRTFGFSLRFATRQTRPVEMWVDGDTFSVLYRPSGRNQRKVICRPFPQATSDGLALKALGDFIDTAQRMLNGNDGYGIPNPRAKFEHVVYYYDEP